MNQIKKYDILCCINEKDSHYLKIGQVEDVEYDKDYSTVVKNVSVKYQDEIINYKALDMEYNFIIVKGQVLTFD